MLITAACERAWIAQQLGIMHMQWAMSLPGPPPLALVLSSIASAYNAGMAGGQFCLQQQLGL
jgi:hypothetical protein